VALLSEVGLEEALEARVVLGSRHSLLRMVLASSVPVRHGHEHLVLLPATVRTMTTMTTMTRMVNVVERQDTARLRIVRIKDFMNKRVSSHLISEEIRAATDIFYNSRNWRRRRINTIFLQGQTIPLH